MSRLNLNMMKNKFLTRPAKEYFMLWVELGTIRRVINHLTLNGEINPRTGKPFSDSAIHRVAMTWVIENPDEAKPYYDKWAGVEVDQKIWEEFIVGKALLVYDTSRQRFAEWVSRHNWALNYEHVYAKRFPNGLVD